MKKIAILTLLLAFTAVLSQAQRFAYIDTEYIMENIPEYQAAQRELDQIAEEWQEDIEAKFDEVEKMYNEYQAEAALLPEDIKQERQQKMIEKEEKAKELQMQRFGEGGDFFQKQQELIQPIQDKIYEAVEEISASGNYAIIFDKASGPVMFYSDVQYDLSDEVLQNLGYRN